MNRLRAEWRAVRSVWSTTHADRSGWTHEYTQKVRDLVRFAPITVATVLSVLIILAIALGVALIF